MQQNQRFDIKTTYEKPFFLKLLTNVDSLYAGSQLVFLKDPPRGPEPLIQ